MNAQFRPPDKVKAVLLDTTVELKGYARPPRKRPVTPFILVAGVVPALMIELNGALPDLVAMTAWSGIMALYFLLSAAYRLGQLRSSQW